LHLLNFIKEESPGDKSVQSLLTSGLAFDLDPCWTMDQHHAGCQFINILAPMASGLYEAFPNIRLANSKGGHALLHLIFLLRPDRERAHEEKLLNGPNDFKEVGLRVCRQLVPEFLLRDSTIAATILNTITVNAAYRPESHAEPDMWLGPICIISMNSGVRPAPTPAIC
jgi:hypothetical protein